MTVVFTPSRDYTRAVVVTVFFRREIPMAKAVIEFAIIPAMAYEFP